MITDQRQTGVPNRATFANSGTRGRTQFVKPNQVTNIGRSLPQNQNLAAALGSNAQATPTSAPTAQTAQATPTYNPVFPQQTQVAQSMPVATASTQVQAPVQTTTTRPQTQSMSEYLKAQAQAQAQAQNPSGAQLTTATANEAEQLIQDKDVARQAIRKMKSTDIIELLDELANGTLTGAD